jgi:hypothetical protein
LRAPIIDHGTSAVTASLTSARVFSRTIDHVNGSLEINNLGDEKHQNKTCTSRSYPITVPLG